MKKGEKMSLEQKMKISNSNKHKHIMTKLGSTSISNFRKGKSPSNKGKICISNIKLNKKMYINKENLNQYLQEGWIKGDYINKVSLANWYKIPENRERHRLSTSIGTKKAMENPEIRAKLRGVANRARFMKIKRKGWKSITKYEALLLDFLTEYGFIYEKKHYINGKVYVSDFCNDKLKIWIEIDGKSHTNNQAIEKDKIRDSNLKSFGYTVLRFKNKDVQYNIENVKSSILACIKGGGSK